MIGWWRFLRSGLEVLLRALDAAGLKGARWEWRKGTWRSALERRAAAAQNQRRDAERRARICRSCRALVGVDADVCHECGASMKPTAASGLASLLERITPSFGSVTMVLVSFNTVLMLLILGIWGWEREAGGLFSILSPSPRALYAFGAKWRPDILNGEIWRLVTAMYLHGGLVHLAFNSYALANLGPLIENSFGGRKFFVIYTVTGIASFVASTLLSPRLSIGASGAIFGLLGFGFVYGRYRAGPVGRAIAGHLMQWIILGAIMLFLPGIDNAAHAGGLVAGGLLALIVDTDEPKTRAGETGLRILTALAVLITIGAFVAMYLSYAESVRRVAGA